MGDIPVSVCLAMMGAAGKGADGFERMWPVGGGNETCIAASGPERQLVGRQAEKNSYQHVWQV